MSHYLAELTAYDPSVGGVITLYFANGVGFVTGPADAVPSRYYDARIKQPIDVRRSLFEGFATLGSSRIGYGELVLINGDAALDILLSYGMDGRQLRILRSSKLAPVYADFQVVLVGTMSQPELQNDEVRIKLRDRQFELQVPLQTTKYSGAGLGTLEGDAATLKGKPKPVLYGSVSNIAPPCVETAKLIYQVNDGLVSSIPAVRDRGIALTSGRVNTAISPLVFGAADDVIASAYGNGLYLVGGTNGKLFTSANGTVFTSRVSGFGTDSIFAIAYGGGVYVIAGTSGLIATSANGTTGWTIRANPFSTSGVFAQIKDLTWTGTQFVAVGSDSVFFAGMIATSPDGITWTSRLVPAGSSVLECCKAANSMIVVGETFGKVYTSQDDGATWTLRFNNSAFGSLRAVAYGNGIWLVTGIPSVGASYSLTSIDGITWTARPSPFSAVSPSVGAWCADYGDQFVVGGDGSRIATSTDGITWKVVTLAGGGSEIHTVTYGALGEVLGGHSGVLSFNRIREYASSAELLNDSLAPAAGSYQIYRNASGSYLRLGADPTGQITCDVKQGAAAANRTAAQVFAQLLAREGLAPAAGDVTALDALNSSEIGFWQGVEELQLSAACDQVVGSVGAWWGVDRIGAFRTKLFTNPTTSPVLTLTKDDLLKPAVRLTPADPDAALPVHRATVRWGKNYTPQDDLAVAVANDFRAFASTQWREAKAEDLGVLVVNLLSPELIEESLLVAESAAQAEADRRLALRRQRRDRMVLVVPLDDDSSPVDLGDTIALVNPRYATWPFGTVLSDDLIKRYVVINIATNAALDQIELTVWGPQLEQENIVSDTAELWVTDAGEYIITSPE